MLKIVPHLKSAAISIRKNVQDFYDYFFTEFQQKKRNLK